MGLASDFGMLFLLDARDKAEATIKKADAYLNKFAGTAERTGAAAKAAGDEIDESLLKTASGADALEVATARVEAAQAKQAKATEEQAAAERNLMEVRSREGVSADELAAANDKLLAADKRVATATSELKDIEKLQADTAKAAAAATGDAAAETDLAAGAQKKAADASKVSKDGMSGLAKAAGLVGLGMAAAGYESVKMAGNFQSSAEHLVTDAGESQAQLGKVEAGMLGISTATGTSAQTIVAGMYHIESSIPPMADAAKRAQIALDDLNVAAEGAKVGGADMDAVTKTLMGTLNAYASSGYTATQMMNALITTTGAGDMKLEDLASSLSASTGIAASAKIPFNQLGGALATMTASGWTAQNASQDLAGTITSLLKPNNVAIAQMNQFGINAQDVSSKLGQRGLTGTLQLLTSSILSHMGPSGQVLLSAFTQSTTAAQDLQTMLGTMPPAIKQLAQQYMNGSMSAKQWTQATQEQTGSNKHLMDQFATLYDKSQSFNSQLAKGGPAAENYTAALGTMMGGQQGLKTALALSGEHMAYFQAATNTVGAALASKSKDVDNWAAIQGTFNQKMSVAKSAVQDTAIAVGSALLPAVTSTLQAITRVVEPIAAWTAKHRGLTEVIFASVTGIGLLVGAIGLANKAFKAVKGAIDTVKSAVSGVTKLFSIFSGSADAAAASTDAAAASADSLAASEDGLTASTEASTVATDANSAGWIRSGLAAAGTAIKFVALRLAQMAGTVATWAATAATWALNAAIAVLTSPITLAVAAIAALAAGVIYAYTHFKVFRDIVQAIWDWMKQTVVNVIEFVKNHWEEIVGIITLPIGGAALIIYKYWDQIKGYFMDAVHAIEGILNWFGSLPGKFWGWLSNTAASVGRGIATTVAWFVGLPGRVASAITGYFSGLAGDFTTWIQGVWNSIDQKGKDVVKWFKDLPGKIKTALGDLSKTLWQAGIDLIQGLIDGIGSMFDHVKDTLGNLASKLTDWKGPPAKDKILLTDNGKLVIQGFITGLDQQIPAVQAKLQSLTATIKGSVAPAAPPTTPSLAAPAGAGANIVNINLDGAFRGANILTDRGMDDVVDKIGRALAIRIGPAAGFRPNM